MPVKKEQPDSSQGEPINGGRPASTSVAGMLLSYSRILRVIGQELEPLGVDAFELVKLRDDFSVSMYQLELKQYPSAQPTILDKFIHKIFGRSDCLIETPHHKYFARREILVADIERQSRRRGSYRPSDQRNLSLELRGLGDYLDRKAAVDFTISWAAPPNMIKVSFDQKSESFTTRDLYDFGIHMYMKRSDRPRAA